MKKNILLLVAILFTCCLPFSASALVADDIAGAASGDVVNIEGEVTENLTIDKSITLKGDDADKLLGNITISGDNIEVVLDGFTLEGHVNVTASNSKVTFQNMTLDGKNTTADNILITVRALNSSVTVDNTLFKGFIKTGIYAETLKSIDVTNSTFNAFGTANIGTLEDYVASNPDAEAIVRSGSCIDLNLGNQSGVQFELDNISIVGNHFEGVRHYVTEGSTAGAVKVKFKNASNITVNNNTGVIIGANEFVDNADDVVIGTSGQVSTASFLVTFYQNTSSENSEGINVTNNASQGKETEVIDSTVVVVRNYSDSSDLDQNVNFFIITINDKDYMVQEGLTLKDAVSVDSEDVIDLDSLMTKEGYIFKNFVEKGTSNVIDADTVITKSMVIETVFADNATITNPETNDNILFIVLGVIICAGVVVISTKKILNKQLFKNGKAILFFQTILVYVKAYGSSWLEKTYYKVIMYKIYFREMKK